MIVALGLFIFAEAMSVDVLPGKDVHAESVEARRSAPVLSGPGESNRLVTRVKAGSQMSVLGRQGRWIKVRVKGRIGWIARSNVLIGDSAPKAKKPKKAFVKGRKTKRNRKAAPRDRRGKSAVQKRIRAEDNEPEEDVILEEPVREMKQVESEPESKKSQNVEISALAKNDSIMRKKPNRAAKGAGFIDDGEKVDVLQERDGWVFIKTDEDRKGWVKRSSLKNFKEHSAGATGYNGWGLLANAGYQVMSQQFGSDGVGELANYETSSAAIAFGIGAEFRYQLKPKWALMADFNYRFVKATPGIRAEVGGVQSDIGFSRHEVNGHLGAGYILSAKRKAAAFFTLGYMNNLFNVSNKDDFTTNIALLPSEVLSGPLLGIKLDVPVVTGKISFSAGVDYLGLVAASRSQTVGLEDGLNEDSSAILARARIGYRLSGRKIITLGYGFESSSVNFDGVVPTSERTHNANTAQRDDVFHTVSVGFGLSK